MGDLISREALIENFGLKNATKYGNKDAEQQAHSYSTLMLYEIADMIEDAPAVEAVPKSYAEQIRWERDVAVGQLNEIGCQFGQKMDEVKKLEAVPVVHCKECKNWHKDIGWCDKHSHFIDSDGEFCHPWESSNWKMFDENDFCSDGEKRDNAVD